MNGRVIIDTDGNIKTSGEITAKKINIDETNKETASIGEGLLQQGDTKVTVKTTAVTENSRIFVTPKTLLAYPLVVTSTKKGESFTVSVKKSEDTDVKFSWWIVN